MNSLENAATSERKTVTIHDVAQRAGISKSTVSRALTGEGKVSAQAREAVFKAAADLGFEPNLNAQMMGRGGGSETIGLFFLNLDLGVGTLKVQVIQHLLGVKGYTVPIHAYGYREIGVALQPEELLRGLLRQSPRAVICNVGNIKNQALEREITRYVNQGGIAVCYDWECLDVADCVIFDREDNSYQAARHLLDLGHRDIGFCSQRGPLSPRWRGVQRALEERGLVMREECAFVPSNYMEFEPGAIELAAQFLALKQRPTGICIVNDHTASAFTSEVMRAGVRVPEDLSIVGHDDSCIARCAPVPLTTVSHPVNAIAEAVVELLDSRVKGTYHGPPRHLTVRGQLVERQSTTAPRLH